MLSATAETSDVTSRFPCKEAPMSDTDRKNPGDEDAPGTKQTAENTCPTCSGSGRVSEKPCPDCGGSGLITAIVGDA
jgi:DnaJ-class molecular chaperone